MASIDPRASFADAARHPGMHALVETALDKLLSSHTLRTSPRLRRFLSHIVRLSLAGDFDRLKEYTIGVEVFERGVRFDPRQDAIVRVEARRLREKLHLYYRREGAADVVTISIPPGGYRAAIQVHDSLPAILDDPDAVGRQAEALILRPTPETISRARHWLQVAIDRWPGRADLYVILAAATLTGVEMEYVSPDEGIPLLRQSAQRALRLDPEHGAAHFYAAIPEIRCRDKRTAVEGAHRAMRSSPSDPIAHYWAASVYAADLNMSEMLSHLQIAVRLEPHAVFFQTWQAVGLFWAGEGALAVRHLRDILTFEPDDFLANHWLGQVCAYTGRFDEAAEAARRAAVLGGSTQAIGGLGFVEARRGNIEAAESVLNTLERTAEREYVALSRIAGIHAALGRLPQAAETLRRAQSDGDWDLAWSSGDARWDQLRGAVPGV